MATRVVDTDEQLFWKEVQECVKLVELNHGMEFKIERHNRMAEIYWYTDDNDIPHICIEIYEIEPKQPALLVP